MVKLILHSQYILGNQVRKDVEQRAREGEGDSIKYAYNSCFSKLSQNCKFQTLDTISRRGYTSQRSEIFFIVTLS